MAAITDVVSGVREREGVIGGISPDPPGSEVFVAMILFN